MCVCYVIIFIPYYDIDVITPVYCTLLLFVNNHISYNAVCHAHIKLYKNIILYIIHY